MSHYNWHFTPRAGQSQSGRHVFIDNRAINLHITTSYKESIGRKRRVEMAGKTKNMVDLRPRKSGLERRRRMNTHRKRLKAFGVSDETLKHMTAVDLREMLKVKRSGSAVKAG